MLVVKVNGHSLLEWRLTDKMALHLLGLIYGKKILVDSLYNAQQEKDVVNCMQRVLTIHISHSGYSCSLYTGDATSGFKDVENEIPV